MEVLLIHRSNAFHSPVFYIQKRLHLFFSSGLRRFVVRRDVVTRMTFPSSSNYQNKSLLLSLRETTPRVRVSAKSLRGGSLVTGAFSRPNDDEEDDEEGKEETNQCVIKILDMHGVRGRVRATPENDDESATVSSVREENQSEFSLKGKYLRESVRCAEQTGSVERATEDRGGGV